MSPLYLLSVRIRCDRTKFRELDYLARFRQVTRDQNLKRQQLAACIDRQEIRMFTLAN